MTRVATVVLAGCRALQGAESDVVVSNDALAGADVINNAGEFIGILREFVSAPQAKHVMIVVVHSGIRAGGGDRLVLVPWQAFQANSHADQSAMQVILDVPVERLQGAVEYDPAQPIPIARVLAYWGIPMLHR